MLNARLPLNSLAADLSPVLRKYFSSSLYENIHEIATKAYISSDEVTEYDQILESLLDNNDISPSTIIRRLEPSTHGEPNVAKAIGAYDGDRPKYGQLQIIQGPVGAGKSLFIRRYRDVLQPDTDSNRTRWAFIDFNSSEDLADVEPATLWLYRSFNEAFRAENATIDLDSTAVLRRIFARNIARRQGIYDDLERASKQEAAVIRNKDLISWQDDPRELARGIAQYVLEDRREILVAVMDNVDRLDLTSQLNAFQLALSFMSLTKAFVILQMRDETYERFKNRPPLDTYRSGIAFHISPPRFVDVVKRRLELSLDYLAKSAPEVQRYTLESGIRLVYPKSQLGDFLREMYVELFGRRHNSTRVLEALAGRDVRRALEIFVNMVVSGHLSSIVASKMLEPAANAIREHHILKVLMRTDYRFASDNSGFTVNLFYFDPEWQRGDNFIFIEILYWLIINRKRHGELGLQGYFSCRTLADELQRIGYVAEDVLAAARYLLTKQLITADHLGSSTLSFDDSIRVLASGFMHLRVLSERVEYLFGVLPTVPFVDEASAQALTSVLVRERDGKAIDQSSVLS